MHCAEQRAKLLLTLGEGGALPGVANRQLELPADVGERRYLVLGPRPGCRRFATKQPDDFTAETQRNVDHRPRAFCGHRLGQRSKACICENIRHDEHALTAKRAQILAKVREV